MRPRHFCYLFVVLDSFVVLLEFTVHGIVKFPNFETFFFCVCVCVCVLSSNHVNYVKKFILLIFLLFVLVKAAVKLMLFVNFVC